MLLHSRREIKNSDNNIVCTYYEEIPNKSVVSLVCWEWELKRLYNQYPRCNIDFNRKGIVLDCIDFNCMTKDYMFLNYLEDFFKYYHFDELIDQRHLIEDRIDFWFLHEDDLWEFSLE